MVPFTIFHRLSSLGSGGGMNAGTIPPGYGTKRAAKCRRAEFHVYLSCTCKSFYLSVTTVTWNF
jgi:hypothetical protein